MWLLNTSTAELRFFHDPSSVRYAILSHVWGEHEQTFQEIQALRTFHFSPASTPRDRASAKVRECCIYAEKAGYLWVWIDTCCIDKTSSAELSEAINSMYAWYARAAVCYAILEDVSENEDPSAPLSTFRRGRWWTRGWTLQELIAPRAVVFLARGWHLIGTKHSLAPVVEEISGVDRGVLVHARTLDDVSVARRMSWAARRVTTREEDRAYSLMGIFGVMMPVVYGEGLRAFTRLQEEIMRHTPDQSIFAWGPILDDYPFSCRGFATERSDPRWSLPKDDTSTTMQTLLAPSPVEFAAARDIRPLGTMELQQRLGVSIAPSEYSVTSSGIRMRLPVLPSQMLLGPAPIIRTPGNIAVAILACEHTENGSLVVLFLRKKDGTLNEYYTGEYIDISDQGELTRAYYRVAFLSTHVPKISKAPQLLDVYVHNRPHTTLRNHIPHRSLPGVDATRQSISYTFVLPQWVLSRLLSAGFVPGGHTSGSSGSGLSLELSVLPGIDVSAVFKRPRFAEVTFTNAVDAGTVFTLTLGVGCVCQAQFMRRGFDAFWVDVALGGPAQARQRQQWTAGLAASGTCTRQHLGHLAAEFCNERRRVRVTTAPWGDVTAGNGAAQYNYIIDLELLAPASDDEAPDDPGFPVNPAAPSVRDTLRRVVEKWMSVSGSSPWM